MDKCICITADDRHDKLCPASVTWQAPPLIESFEDWMIELDEEIRQQPENVQALFDLRPLNWECWRDMYEENVSPEDAVVMNIEAAI